MDFEKEKRGTEVVTPPERKRVGRPAIPLKPPATKGLPIEFGAPQYASPIRTEELENQLELIESLPETRQYEIKKDLILGRAAAEELPESIARQFRDHGILIKEMIGKGGMGSVYKAEQIFGREVALKMLTGQAGFYEVKVTETQLKRFQREARILAGLEHDNIVRVYDAGFTQDGGWMAMRLIKGKDFSQSLNEQWSKKEPPPISELIEVITQATRGLAASHQKGIIHRDIKPANILISEEPDERPEATVKLSDFGLAKQIEQQAILREAEKISEAEKIVPVPGKKAEYPKKPVTQTGRIVGTPAYYSPEQASGKEATRASDVFSLGVTLYETVTNQKPFEADTSLGTLKNIRDEKPIDPKLLRSDISPELNNLILKMLEKEPEKRPTAPEVLNSLQDISRRIKLREVGERLRERKKQRRVSA